MEQPLSKTSLPGTAMAQGVHMTMQSGRTTGASPTAWNLVCHLPQRLADRAQMASCAQNKTRSLHSDAMPHPALMLLVALAQSSRACGTTTQGRQ